MSAVDERGVPSVVVSLEIAARSTAGVRRDLNQDTALVADLGARRRITAPMRGVVTAGERGVLLGVFDGLGGQSVGDVASGMAARDVQASMERSEHRPGKEADAAALARAIEGAGLRIWREAGTHPELALMATTATVALVCVDQLVIGHVGDTRAYLARGGRLVRLTADHSVASDLAMTGLVGADVAARCSHLLDRALGADDTVQVDVTRVELRREDVILLCSDGLTKTVGDDDIRSVLRRCPAPDEACELLLRMARAGGSVDDVTAIVARVGGTLPRPDVLDVRTLSPRRTA